MSKIFVCFAVLSIFLFLTKEIAGSCKGCVDLDSLTFDKIIENFKISVIKFDVSYPYGPKHDAFENFAQNTADTSGLIVGSVGVKDYGEKDNQDLADRYGFKDIKDLPKVVLFRQDNVKAPIHFKDEEFTADALLRFVRQNSDVYLGLAGCVREFDEIAARFIAGEQQKELLAEGEKLAETFVGKKEEGMVKIYIAYMNRIIERGLTFVEAEKQRLKKIMNGKITDAKKDDLKRRLNVLESFTSAESKGIKNEL